MNDSYGTRLRKLLVALDPGYTGLLFASLPEVHRFGVTKSRYYVSATLQIHGEEVSVYLYKDGKWREDDSLEPETPAIFSTRRAAEAARQKAMPLLN